MYKEDSRFEKPENDQAKIWRYMDFAKLVWMLDQQCLYFCNVDRLKDEDPFEGSYQPSPLLKDVPANEAQDFTEKVKSCGPPLTVNCWHLNDFESPAMWKLYSSGNKGIAIQSTFGGLVKALNGFPDTVRIGKVRYIDYQSERFEGEWLEIFEPVITKRKSFEHERELRAVIWETSESTVRTNDGSALASVSLKELIKCIFVSPFSPSWVRDTAESVIRKYGIDVDVKPSQLNTRPLY